MSKKEELFCEECGADFVNDEECKCHIVAAELDPAREPDAIEVLISVAKKALKTLDGVAEWADGPMAMPLPVAEELREAVYSLEDIMSLLPYETLVKLRMEMIAADFNARTMRQDDIEDLSAYFDKVVASGEFGPLVPLQEDGIEIDPMDDDGMIGAADPSMLERFTAKSQEDLAVSNLRFLMRNDSPIEAGQRIGMTIKEVIDTYKPDIQVKCPHVEECIAVESDGFRTCPHSDFHRVDEGCFYGCDLHFESTGCKPMEDFSDEETIE